MRFLGFLVIILCIFSCNHSTYQVEDNILSKEEEMVINNYFNINQNNKIDTINNKIKSIKIQTH